MTAPVRALVVWCPDWPVVAAGIGLDLPAAVLHANRVVATTPAARAEGVAGHQRRREAQARCPDLVLAEHDPARDARAFEPVVAALDELTPRLELTRPGQVTFPTRGPSRYFGGDDALAARAQHLAAAVLGDRGPVRVGIADGPFAAGLAARAASPSVPTCVITPGATPAFLAPVPLHALDRPELVDVLGRLGLDCLGDLAALPATDVLARFGAEGLAAWRLAAGLDERPPATEPPAPELRMVAELDPPADTIEPAAFVARGLADELHRRLDARGSACTRILIGAETEHGERLERVWRHEGALTVAAIADRVRWQLDGWLNGSGRQRPTAGLTRLWLAPDEVVPAGGRQLGFWGSDAAAGDRATRAVARVQGLLGTGAVAVPEWRGGRDPAEQVALVAAEAVDITDRSAGTSLPGSTSDMTGRVRCPEPAAPWPGRIPAPSPTAVFTPPRSAEVADEAGRAVGVSGRGLVSAPPARLRVDGGPWLAVTAWAGPWPVEERWWDAARRRRRARFQLVDAAGSAHLATLESGHWTVDATYD